MYRWFNINGGSYTSVYKGGDGFNGNCTVANWEMKPTSRFKGATEIFAKQFEAVKGGRILPMYLETIKELHLLKMK